jgi:high-affinity Fe2+/Pb2+ permease
MLKLNGKENTMIVVQVVAGVLAAAVLGIIVYRRKQKTV